MFSLILVFLTVVICVHYLLRIDGYWKSRGVPSTSFIGTSLEQILVMVFKTNDIATWFDNIYKKINGRYIGTLQFGQPGLIINDPDLIKQVMVKNFENFPNRMKFAGESDPLMAQSLLNLTGQKWKNMRSILSPAFTSSKMRGMFIYMQESSEQFCKYFSKQLSNKEVHIFEAKDAFTRYTNDVIANTVFGVKCDSLEDRENEFYTTGRQVNFTSPKVALKMLGYVAAPRFMKLFGIKLFGAAGDYFGKIVEECVEQREKEGIVRMDMIHLMMEARKGQLKNDGKEEVDTGFATVTEEQQKVEGKLELNLDAIKANTILFFAAGFDTTATVLSFLAYELATNPDVQEKLQKEIDEALQKYDGQITYEGLLKMKYLDMVVCEVLRLWPPGFVTSRQCTSPFTFEPVLPNEKPLLIEKDVVITVPIYCIQRDPRFFDNPDKFVPERFSDENKGNIQPYTYMPFGLGPRNCISSRFGLLETKIVIFHFLAKFNFVVTEKTDVPFQRAKGPFGLTAKNGFWVGATKRQAS